MRSEVSDKNWGQCSGDPRLGTLIFLPTFSLSGAITLDWPTRNAQINKIMREAPTRPKTRVDQPIAVGYYSLGPLLKDNYR